MPCVKVANSIFVMKIAIANQKGGEGKTTTALNISHGLALRGYKTLLVDIDPQGNSSGIYIDPQTQNISIADLFLNNKTVSNVIQKTKYDNLFLIPSKINLAEVEFSSLNVEAPYMLRDAFSKSKEKFDYVIIDCPPSLSILTINALVYANSVIVPLQAEKFSLDGIQGLQTTIDSIKRRINPELTILGALITQLKSYTVLTKKILPVIKNYFPVFQSTISAGVSVGESHLVQKTVLDYNPSSKQAQEYLSLVDEVENAIKEKQ